MTTACKMCTRLFVSFAKHLGSSGGYCLCPRSPLLGPTRQCATIKWNCVLFAHQGIECQSHPTPHHAKDVHTQGLGGLGRADYSWKRTLESLGRGSQKQQRADASLIHSRLGLRHHLSRGLSHHHPNQGYPLPPSTHLPNAPLAARSDAAQPLAHSLIAWQHQLTTGEGAASNAKL